MPKREMSKGKKDCRFLKPASRTNHFIGTVYKCSKCMPSVRPRSALSKSSNMSFSKERRILEEGRFQEDRISSPIVYKVETMEN